MEKTFCLIHVTGSYTNGHWEKEIRARNRTARVTQIVTESLWHVHVLRRNRSGGAGPVGVGVKISHRLGVEPDAVVTPLLSPKRVLDLDRVASPPQTLVRVDVSKVVGLIFFWVVRVIIRVNGGGVGCFRMSKGLDSCVRSHVCRVAGKVGLTGAVTGELGHQRLQALLSTLDLLEAFVVETAGCS